MSQFNKPIWGVQSTRVGMIAGRSTLPLAADAQRFGKRFCTFFVTADNEREAIKIAANFEWQMGGIPKGVQQVTHAHTKARILISAPSF